MAADPLTSRTVDNLLAEEIDFDFDDDPFADPKPPQNTTRDDKATLSPRKRKAGQDDIFGGNVDEEVKIVKQRAKIPKLDVDRLCSKPGIPQIRELIRSGKLKKKLRLKGKGHEFSDVARLLNYYQIWLDQLYPRAKFADALQLVEKAGHNKRMQIMRKTWIDEGKPWYSRREEVEIALDEQRADEANTSASREKQQQQNEHEDEGPSMMFLGMDNAAEQERDLNGPDDDELDFLLAQEQHAPSVPVKVTREEDSEGEDDLDALLAEQDNRKSRPRPVVVEDDQDDLDALLEEQETEQQTHSKSVKANIVPISEEDEDELDALLNEDVQTNTLKVTKISNQAEEADMFNDNYEDDNLDDLDTLLAERRESPTGDSEPELPPIATATPTIKSIPVAAAQDSAPGSEEVPELDNVISSSPIPNVRTDELDDLMDEHDAKINQREAHTPRKGKDDSQLMEQFMSSSPIPNEIS